MICPHCKKRISRVVKGKAAKKADDLKRHGISVREIHRRLVKDGYRLSLSSVTRYLDEPNRQ